MQDSNQPNGVGSSRPQPQFGSGTAPAHQRAENMLETGPKFSKRARSPADERSCTSTDDYKVSVPEVILRLQEVGISKSASSVRRWCREGQLNCQKIGIFKLHHATESSVEKRIEEELHDQRAQTISDAHAHPSTSMPEHELPQTELLSKVSDAHARAQESVHEHAPRTAAEDDMVEFLKNQIQTKDKQLEVKDEQIATMLERDRETNILIQGLQSALTNVVGLLNSGGRDDKRQHEGDNRPDGGSQYGV